MAKTIMMRALMRDEITSACQEGGGIGAASQFHA